MHDSGKDTNPKDALGVKKAPLHCIPCGPEFEIGLAMMEGGRKYGTHNYRAVGVRASVYYDAIMRHVKLWWEGEDIDLDSGLHHLIKAAASIVVMRDGMLMDNYIDDRPLKYPGGLKMPSFNAQAAKLIEKYPDCVAPFLEKDEKEFVCPAGWVITSWCDCGWLVKTNKTKMNEYLHKDNQLHLMTNWDNHKFGEAPGYWPTKEEAELALAAYLEKQ